MLRDKVIDLDLTEVWFASELLEKDQGAYFSAFRIGTLLVKNLQNILGCESHIF